MYGGYRPPSVTPNVGQLQQPSKTDDERVAREKDSIHAFRIHDALRMGWFKNNADLMERFNMLLRTVKNKKQIHHIHMLSVDPVRQVRMTTNQYNLQDFHQSGLLHQQEH